MPYHYVQDRFGDQVALPCTERNIDLDKIALAQARGFMAVSAVKGRDELRLTSFNSVKGGEILGPWTGSRRLRPRLRTRAACRTRRHRRRQRLNPMTPTSAWTAWTWMIWGWTIWIPAAAVMTAMTAIWTICCRPSGMTARTAMTTAEWTRIWPRFWMICDASD